MWIWQYIQISLVILLHIATSHCRPIALHNYAPDHSYKSTDYSFSYGVKDLHTGDVKHQWEKKNDGVVRGHYSVLEPDGSVRTVDYIAGGKNGFNAVVNHLPSKTTYTNLQETIKTEYQFDDGNNEIKQYYFVPQEEETTENKIKVAAPIYYQTTTPKLPIDINIIKQTTEKIIPIDVSQLTPVEIDLNPPPQKNSLRELNSEELKKFLKEYYQSGFDISNQPQLEGGFRPVKSQVTEARIPQTYNSGKKPATTPGLMHYASGRRGSRGATYPRGVTIRVRTS